jgi:DNA topoisomerase-1
MPTAAASKVASSDDLALLRKVERGGRARWLRRRGGKQRGFFYEDCAGHRVTDRAELARIRALVLPPAWRHVRISPSARSCLQAVGVDTSGRVQYRYNPAYCARQSRRKYEKIERFGTALPALRRATNVHLSARGTSLSRERVLAVVVRLINELYFRVGSEKSVRRYRTYGITTLRNRHLTIERGGRLVFGFVGKHHVRHRRVLVDAALARVMADLKRLGGPKLFEYVGEDGSIRAVTSRDVNAYIKSLAGDGEFSAKDFRTWGGTLMAAVALAEAGPPASEREAKRNVARAVQRVAERLGNTPAVCRACYVHPAVIERYVAEGVTLAHFRPRAERRIRREQPDYEPEELALLALLRREPIAAPQRVAA